VLSLRKIYFDCKNSPIWLLENEMTLSDTQFSKTVDKSRQIWSPWTGFTGEMLHLIGKK
jgi:hypothetical protein